MIPTGLSPGTATSEYLSASGSVLPAYRPMMDILEGMGPVVLQERWRRAKREAALDGFTFSLEPRTFRPVPTDWIPRVIPQGEWEPIGRGVEQRLKAINCFLADLYSGAQTIVPNDVIFTCQYYYPEYQDFRPARDVFVHVYGIDLVHVGDGQYAVLEDNLRIPSGIAYQLKCVEIARRIMPELAEAYDIVRYDIRDTYLDLFTSLCDTGLSHLRPAHRQQVRSGLLRAPLPGRPAGHPLVEGSDLYIGFDGRVYARSVDGDVAVDLIYRRVEDLEIFLPGLTEAYLQGKVVLVNGMGTSAADDKLVFLWVPEMIRHYLGEEPILRQAPSYDLNHTESLRYVLENLDRLVLKIRQGYGGLGVYIMPDLDMSYRSRMARNIIEQPRAYIAQETLDFSRHLIFDEATGSFEERYVDLRVFAVQNGRGEAHAFPGGLTRVANANSRITNNSSGGLCKPTWVIR